MLWQIDPETALDIVRGRYGERTPDAWWRWERAADRPSAVRRATTRTLSMLGDAAEALAATARALAARLERSAGTN